MTILLVEDEMLIASDTQRELEEEGYTVSMTTSGLKAIAFVKDRAAEIDLILMDINLGRGMDGTEAARAILDEFDIPILFLSSYTDRGTLEKTQNISSYGFVVKSAGTPVLLASVRMAINLHGLLQELRKPETGMKWEDDVESLMRPAALSESEERVLNAEEDLRSALAQKDVLVREMRHRIKNSLAVVSGLLALEAENLDHSGCREVMRKTRTRILSISSIYDLLNQSTDPSSVDLSALAVRLGDSLTKSHSELGRRFVLKTDLPDARLDAQRAFPLAFILNELITNALKHAYPTGGNGGEIRLVLRKNEEKIVLRVEDDGVGLPEGVDPKTAGTTGLSLVRILAEQIDAVCVFSSEGGTKVSLEMPV
ncbi:MAG: response regulator [Candidatus Aminicenantes bacterium]|nr:response regulator [Candidatus Aminicenantes bacterium]